MNVIICVYRSIIISDHAPIVPSMSLPLLSQRDRHWQCNSTLLSDNSFDELIEKEIDFFFATNLYLDMSNLVVWDALKAYLRDQRSDLAQIQEVDRKYAQTKSPHHVTCMMTNQIK